MFPAICMQHAYCQDRVAFCMATSCPFLWTIGIDDLLPKIPPVRLAANDLLAFASLKLTKVRNTVP